MDFFVIRKLLSPYRFTMIGRFLLIFSNFECCKEEISASDKLHHGDIKMLSMTILTGKIGLKPFTIVIKFLTFQDIKNNVNHR